MIKHCKATAPGSMGATIGGLIYPEGISHQAGTPSFHDGMVYINECVKITNDLDAGATILQLPREVAYAYGTIMQTANGIPTVGTCYASGSNVIVSEPVKKSNGEYPKIVITTRLV